jgi:hypothetical protein
VGVRFLKPRKFGRKGFLMKGDDLVIGDKGILRYQGVYGLSFQLEAHIIKKDYHQKFGFMVHKQRRPSSKWRGRNVRNENIGNGKALQLWWNCTTVLQGLIDFKVQFA